jgi:hypothetical protein
MRFGMYDPPEPRAKGDRVAQLDVARSVEMETNNARCYRLKLIVVLPQSSIVTRAIQLDQSRNRFINII